MKNTKPTTTKQDLRRALLLISKIAMIQNPDETDRAWSDVYTVAHSFSGTCLNPHSDWRNQLGELEEKLKDS